MILANIFDGLNFIVTVLQPFALRNSLIIITIKVVIKVFFELLLQVDNGLLAHHLYLAGNTLV